MLSAACVVSAMQAAEAGSSAAGGGHCEAQQHDELRQVALRMRNEMPLKERTIHLQTFKYTFTGQQAVSFLQQQGMAGNLDVAADMCQRMLTQGLFKSSSHREVFLADGEVYRFSSSFPDGHKQKNRIPGSITSTGLYKEIAKIGKTAAQPFKNIQLSLNDTFNSLQSLSIPAAPKPGQLVSSLGGGGSRPHSSGNGTARNMGPMRRSQTGKLHHMYSDSTHGVPDPASSLAMLASSMDVLQASIKESTSLLRLDLQQHTALQEHLVGLLMAQQDTMRTTQLLIAINATAVLLLLGYSGTWSSFLLAAAMLGLLVYSVGLEVVLGRSRQAGLVHVEGGILRRGSVVTGGGGLEPSLARVSLRAQAATAGVSEAGGGFASAHDRADVDRESDEVEDLEDSIPYIEDFEDWPDAPVMLCPDPAAAQQEFAVEGPGPCHALAANGDPIPFESELFRGVVAIYIRHLPTTPPHLFKGKKRLGWVALQGTFKRPVSMDNLVYGMEFSHQLSNLPAPWFLENMLLPLAGKISPSLRVGTLEDPFFFSPIITASQVVNVSLPGQAPHLMEAKEDTRLLQQELGGKAGDGLTVASRRRYFQTASNRQDMPFSPEYVWTFHLWQEYIDYASYMLNLGYSSYDLAQHLDGQPLQVMAKDESTGQQLISLHVWHANLVRCLTQRLPRRTRASRISNASQEDLPDRRSLQGTQGGTELDTAAVSPTGTSFQPTPEQQLTPTNTQLQQQQQQERRLSTELDLTPTQQQLQQRFDQQALEQQQQQQQREPRVSASGGSQLPTSLSNSSKGSTSQQQQQQRPDGSSLSESQLQRPTGLGLRDGCGSVSDNDRARCSSPPPLLQLSNLSNSRPSRQSVSFTSRGGQGLSGTQQEQQQQQQQQQQQRVSSKSLPPQQQQQQMLQADGQQQQQRGEASAVDPTSSSAGDGSSGTFAAAAAAGDTSPVVGASGRSEGSLAAAAAAGVTRAPSVSRAASDTSRSGRLSSAASAVERDLFSSSDGTAWDSLLASRTPGAGGVGGGGLHHTSNSTSGGGSGGGTGGAAGGMGGGGGAAGMLLRPQQQQHQQQQAQLLQQTSSGRRKKKDRPDKEEQQRHQLQGLSVMGAL